MNTVIFACVHNAGRSQMAAAWFNRLSDPKKARAVSAGTQPAARVHPEVVEAMREVGLELEGVRPQQLTGELFEKLGFTAIPRAHVPPSIAASLEFAQVCPASAKCLRIHTADATL